MRNVAALFVVALHVTLVSCASSGATRPTHAQSDDYSRDPWGWEADDGWNERAAFHMAQREFRESTLADGDDHFGLGLEMAGEPYDAWIGIEIALFTTSSLAQWSRWGPVFSGLDDEDLDIGAAESRSFELSLGAHKEVRPFGGPLAITFGTGAALLEIEEAELDVTFTSDDDADIGWYGHVGLHYVLAAPGRIGIDLRMLEGTEHELSGRTLSGDYRQIAFVFSFYF